MKKRAPLYTTFVMILSLLFFPGITFSAKIRIMPLGDSITEGDGSSDSAGYRKYLYDRLVEDVYDVNFVGSQAAGPASFDRDHEGHGGWLADGLVSRSILKNLTENLQFLNIVTENRGDPDIVLLHIGTNDITGLQDPTGVKNEIDSILTKIFAYNPSIWVVMALIINRENYSDNTAKLNQYLFDLSNQRIAQGDRIVRVDQENALLYPDDLFDEVHPNNSGYRKMADEWFIGLLEILPTANAGADKNANPEVSVFLDGRASSESRLGAATNYAWSQTGGIPTVTIDNALTKVASFIAPSVRGGTTLTFRLTLTDDKEFSHSDECNVAINGPPLASAGEDQAVIEHTTVTLDGTGSTDPGGSISTYRWVQVGGPAVDLSDANTARATFRAPTVGSDGVDLTFQLTVTDKEGAQDADTCIVHIVGTPVADAGPDQSVEPGTVVNLDGSGSTGAFNDVLSYHWIQTSGPAVALIDDSSARTTFSAPSAIESEILLDFSLTVKNQSGLQSTDFCTVTVSPNRGSSGSGGGGGGCFITAAGSGGKKGLATDLK